MVREKEREGVGGEGKEKKKRLYSEGGNGATATAWQTNEVATGRQVEREGAVGSVRWARGARGLCQARGSFAFAVQGQPLSTYSQQAKLPANG